MIKVNHILKIFVCLCVVCSNVFADQIILKSGDRLTGKVVSQDDEKVVLQTDFAGILTILKSSIEQVSISDTKAFETATVNKQAQKESSAPKAEDIEKAEETAKIVEIAKVEEPNAKESALAGASASIVPKKRALSFTSGWDGAANLGFSYTSGNSRTMIFTSGVRAEKSGENDKITTYFNALWNRNRVADINLTTSNAIWGGVRYDRNISKKWFAFGSFDFERDKPQLLNFRSVLGAGLGYHAIKNDRTELDVFSGAAWNRSWFFGPNTSSAEVLIGNTLKHKINERVKFQQGFTFYPNLTDTGEYRMIFDSTLSADVTKRIGWFVTVGDRFNSAPVFEAQKNDFLFTTGLKWSFGKVK